MSNKQANLSARLCAFFTTLSLSSWPTPPTTAPRVTYLHHNFVAALTPSSVPAEPYYQAPRIQKIKKKKNEIFLTLTPRVDEKRRRISTLHRGKQRRKLEEGFTISYSLFFFWLKYPLAFSFFVVGIKLFSKFI